MSALRLGVVDYGIGNHASVVRAFGALGYRGRVSARADELSATDVLVLPGVGAFPAAMAALYRAGLVDHLQAAARAGTPLIGICLGMQLLADRSAEGGDTAGLGLIPGTVDSDPAHGWNIGWNTIEAAGDPMFAPVDGQSVYFNHGYFYRAPVKYRACIARRPEPFTAAVRRGNIVGVQFHPERSQDAGRAVLRAIIDGLTT